MNNAFEASPPLCFPHLAAALGATRDPGIRRRLADTQSAKVVKLLSQIDEFCRKHDHRFANEPFGAERDSWLRAIDIIAGARDVF